MSVERREVLRVLGAAALAELTVSELFATGRAIQASAAPARRSEPHRFEILDATGRQLVLAVADIILPETDTPGAASPGVGLAAFIDRLLAEWFTEAERARFLEGLSRLADADFLGMRGADRLRHLESLEADAAGVERAESPADAPFIAVVKWLTVYGFFTSEVGNALGLDFVAFHGTFDGCAPLRK